MNLKHGFYSTNPSLNPDMVLLSRGRTHCAALNMMMAMLDDERVNVGQLMTAYGLNAPIPLPDGVKSLKTWLWWLCSEVDKHFAYESNEAKYANMVALMGSALEEFNIDSSVRPYSFIVSNPKPNSLDQCEYTMNSLMTKIKKLRGKF
ncbi:MAG: hypothetical protein CL578_05840 [Alteromonadaceae bacterium]|uniref:hypothetical protein n=1 Tax=uncultured Paraglaciecola sp. TaxID=1765024 RepID=UPI000C5B4DD5|nr:hypothetical protein [Alteromonadaceae bacterium]|tara:strand:+ start:15868 stop:16311 length:444 start_codon:yes stop_codon:yes gene_type:complete